MGRVDPWAILDRPKRPVRLDRAVDKTPTHGTVRYVVRGDAPSREAKLAALKAHEACQAIDRDYRRGGYPSHMRHAR